MKIQTVNEFGLREIREFLAQNHKRGGDLTDEMINAWASSAEFQLGEGNSPTIEIRSYDAIDGHTIEYRISNDGIDTQEIDDE